MKASELRIGNLIYYNGTNGPTYNINKIDGVDIATMEGDAKYLSFHEPIPLTEEWLLKFGFKKINHRIEGVIYRREWLQFSETFLADWRGGHIGRIQYVHQLQNLYFALTNTELIIK